MRFNNTKVFACTSFKGGSGRSVSTANLAFQLAKKYKVGIIDFDTEAGGLHYIFEIGDLKTKLGVQHIMMDEADYTTFTCEERPDFDNKEVFINKLCINIKERDSIIKKCKDVKGEFYLIQAKLDANLTAMVDTTRGAFFRFNKLLENFSSFLDLDYIFIDCRSGISNLGLPGLAFCDVALVFLRWGTQHRNGTEKMLEWYSKWLKKAGLPTKIFIIASTINEKITTKDNIDEYIDKFNDLDIAGSGYIPEIEELKKTDSIIIDGKNQIPFIDLAESIAKL